MIIFLLNKIKKFRKFELFNYLTKQCWNTFVNNEINKYQKNNDAKSRKNIENFIRGVPWFCFLLFNKIENKNPKNISKQNISELSTRIYIFLSNKYFNIDVGIINKKVLEFKIYLEEMKKAENENHLSLSAIPDPDWHKICEAMLHESFISTCDYGIDIKYGYIGLARSLSIYNELEKELDTTKRIKLQNGMGVDPLKFHQFLMLIFCLCTDKPFGMINQKCLRQKLKTRYPVFEEAKIDEIEREIWKVLNLISHSENNIENDLDVFIDKYKSQLSPIHMYNSFFKFPFVCINNNIFISPSPYIFFFSTSWLFWVLINNKKLSNLDNEIGRAVSRYIERLVLHFSNQNQFIKSIKNIDNYPKDIQKSKSNTIKHADFLVETENYVFIIECKNSLGLRAPYDSTKKDGLEIIKRWDRISGAFKQCAVSQKTYGQEYAHKKVFNLIVVNETVSAQIITWSMYAYYTDFLQEIGLKWGQIACVSFAQFENLVSTNSLEFFALNCEQQSEKLKLKKNEDINYHDFLSAMSIEINTNSVIDDSFLKETIKQLENI